MARILRTEMCEYHCFFIWGLFACRKQSRVEREELGFSCETAVRPLVHRRLIFNSLMFTRLLPAIGHASDHVLMPSRRASYSANRLRNRLLASSRIGRLVDRGISVSRDRASRPGQRPRLYYYGRPQLIISHYLLYGRGCGVGRGRGAGVALGVGVGVGVGVGAGP